VTKKVYVTKAQSRAASAIVERSAVTGRYVRPGVARIAAAAPQPSKSSAGSALSQAPKK
jgi:hypothetical protein